VLPNRLFTNDALFDSTTGALISDTQGANTTGKVLRELDPTYTDEVLFGYATPLAGHWSIDAFYLYRTSKDFIEDQPTVLPASTFVVDNLSNAFRKYRAFTVELSRPLRDKWSLTASYALTRLWGNFDLDYSTVAVFNTSSILQDGPGVFVEDRFREGPLSQDRTHVLKIFASYVPKPSLTFGGIGPQGMISSPSACVFWIACSVVACPSNTLERPTSSVSLKMRCIIGLRVSASMSSTLRPDCAIAIARLEAIVVLPSPGEGEVTRIVLHLVGSASPK